MPELEIRLVGNEWCVIDSTSGDDIMSYDRSEWGDFAQKAARNWKDAYMRGWKEGLEEEGYNFD